MRENGASGPESIAADIAAVIEKVAALAVAEIAELVNEHRPAAEQRY